MPFMIGRAPIRRTLKFLEAGELVLKDKIQIVSINYNTFGNHHQGTRDFVFWFLPRIQYKNPKVQIVTFKNMTPSPFIKCYYGDGKTMLIDVDSKTKEEIMDHLVQVVGKTKEILDAEALVKQKIENPANFGVGCRRGCICSIIGQVPCSATVPVPNHRRGKVKFARD